MRFDLGFALRIALFLFAFSLEVRVKAESIQLPETESVLQEPKDCLLASVACALRTKRAEKYRLEFEGATVTLDQLTTVIREKSGTIRLVEGTVRVESERTRVSIKSEFGEAIVERGEAWVRRDREKAYVTAVKGEAELRPRGSDEVLIVEAGFENWVSRVNDKGRAETGIPIALSLRDHLDRWARLFDGNKREFKEEADRFVDTWREATERAAALHKAVLERTVASAQEDRARKAEGRRKSEAADHELRALFRRKVMGVE